jgi:ubiquinone/menaquinone biosynthesis C-methylase UbiE
MYTDSKTIFNALAEQYDAYRPHYPAEAILFLVTLAELDRTSDVADIGSGTGRIALELAKYVRLVYAVDTAAAMLEQLNNHAQEEGLTNIRTLESPAEETGLPSESLAMTVLAQSFHWVNKPVALKEMHRVLEPAKPLVLIWNQVQNTSDLYYQEIVSLIKQYNPTYRGGADILSADFQPIIESTGLFDSVEQFNFPFSKQFTFEAYLGFLLSKSYIGAAITSDKLPEFMEAVYGILGEYFPGGKVTEKYDSVVMVARKK